jgi:hypothetical protein
LLRLLTPDGFALAPLWTQLVLIFGVSALLILGFAPLIGSLSLSYALFADLSSYSTAEGPRQLIFGFFQLVCGLILVSLIISVLTAALEELIERIRGGTRPYHKKDHILIVNRNAKLPFILEEMNTKYADLHRVLDVVILLASREQVEELWQELELAHWPFLNIYVRQGELLDFAAYEKVSILSALGLLVLADDAQTSPYLADSRNLKILCTLANETAFWTHLQARHAEKNPVKCAVELFDTVKSRPIAESLASLGTENLFCVVTAGDVVTSVLSRTIIDFAYYGMHLQLFSFENHTVYFVNPKRFAPAGLRFGLRFEELCPRFTQGILIGYSCATPAGLEVLLSPMGRALQTGEWLLFIAQSERAIGYEDAPLPPMPLPGAVAIPSEIRHCRLCLIGAEHTFDRLGDFLDEPSREWLRRHQFVFEKPEEYFTAEFIQRVRTGGFDKIIVNLDDDAAFRFCLFIRQMFGEDDSFVRNIITVLQDPVTQSMLDARGKNRTTILSDKLAAKYTAQLTFQKNLEKVYQELTSRDHAQIKLLDIDKDIPRGRLTSKSAVKQLLLAHGLVYLGVVNAQKETHFDADDFTQAAQIAVICMIKA